MQKINREALKEALAKDAQNYPHAQCDSTIRQAAAAFLEITDPEFVPPQEMYDSARDRDQFDNLYSDIFRAMIKELTE